MRYVEITGEDGNCYAPDIYSTRWFGDALDRPSPYRDLMEWLELAGGVAEAIYHGERRGREALRFAEVHCGIDADLTKAADVLADLRRLSGYHLYPQHFADRTLALLLERWPAVTALAKRRG